MTKIPIFNPICTTKASIENNLKNFSASYSDSDDNIQFIHPFSDKEQCIYEKGKCKWEQFQHSRNLDSLLNVESDLSRQEDAILDIIKKYSLELNLNFNAQNITIQPLPEGEETIECAIDISDSAPPPLFVVSKYRNNEYFDLVVYPSFSRSELEDNQSPIYFSNKDLENFPFIHSGDRRQVGKLLHYIRYDSHRHKNVDATGVVIAHAYWNKTFLQITHCEPNICFVDYRKETNTVNIYVCYFQLSRDFVNNSRICYYCTFDYLADDGKMVWTIPQQPTFVEDKFGVGCTYVKYRNGILELMNKIRRIKRGGGKRMRMRMQLEDENEEQMQITTTTSSNTDTNMTTDIDPDKHLLVIQKPLYLQGKICPRILNRFARDANFDIYTFHRNIGVIDDQNDVDEHDWNYSYTLPIAGGSIVSEKSSVKLGKPIMNEFAAQTFWGRITRGQTRPVVITSNQASSADIPKIHSKLNAIYILIDVNNSYGNGNLTEEQLNNINATLPVFMQGSLSTVFVHSFVEGNDDIMPPFYYYRGVINNRHSVKFGDQFTLDQILSEIESLPMPSSLLSETSTSTNTIYNRKGVTLFDLDNDDIQVEFIIDQIINHLDNDDSIEAQIKFIIAQMEVYLSAKDFQKIIESVCERVYKSARITQRACLNLIIDHQAQLPEDCPAKVVIREFIKNNHNSIDGPYSKNWLLPTLSQMCNIGDKFTFLKERGNLFQAVIQLMNDYKKHTVNYTQSLLDILNTSVSMRSSYGIRKKGLAQIVRSKHIQQNVAAVDEMNEDDMDDFLMEYCTDDGVIFFAVKPNLFISNNERLTERLANFDRSNSLLASSYLSNFNRFNFSYERRDMLMIPILKILVERMKEPHKHNWSEINDKGPIELTRIMLRSTIFNLLSEETRKKNGINSPGSPIVGQILINVLFSAVYSMAGGRTNFDTSDEDSAWITQFRCLIGLIISIMASGADCPFSLVYQTALFGDGYSNIKINMTKQNERLWLGQMLKAWEFLKLPNIDVKTNAIQCLQNRLVDKVKYVVNSDTKITVEDKKKEEQLKLHDKAKHVQEVLYPIVTYILSFGYDDIKEEEEKLNTQFNNNQQKYLRLPIYQFYEVVTDREKAELDREVETVIKMEEAKRTVLQTGKFHRIFAVESEFPNNLKVDIEKVLEVFNNIEIFMKGKSKSEKLKFYRSKLIKNLSRLKEANQRGSNVDKILSVIWATAKEHYLEHSLSILEPVMRLENYIFYRNEANVEKSRNQIEIEREIIRKKIQDKKKKLPIPMDIDMDNNNDMDTDIDINTIIGMTTASSTKFDENFDTVNKRKFSQSELRDFSLDQAHTLKYGIFQKLFKFKSSLYNYQVMDKLFKELMYCHTAQDYKSKKITNLLTDYIHKKLKVYGNFMQKCMLKPNDALLKYDEEAIKREKFERAVNKALTEDEQTRSIVEFLTPFYNSSEAVVGTAIEKITL